MNLAQHRVSRETVIQIARDLGRAAPFDPESLETTDAVVRPGRDGHGGNSKASEPNRLARVRPRFALRAPMETARRSRAGPLRL